MIMAAPILHIPPPNLTITTNQRMFLRQLVVLCCRQDRFDTSIRWYIPHNPKGKLKEIESNFTQIYRCNNLQPNIETGNGMFLDRCSLSFCYCSHFPYESNFSFHVQQFDKVFIWCWRVVSWLGGNNTVK